MLYDYFGNLLSFKAGADMNRKLFSTALILALCFSLICGCKANSPISQGTYIANISDEIAEIKPTVTFILSDNTFIFFYDPFSSYFEYGKYTVENDKIVANTDNGKNIYIFKIVDEKTVSFVADGSSELKMTEGELSVIDGTEFVCE